MSEYSISINFSDKLKKKTEKYHLKKIASFFEDEDISLSNINLDSSSRDRFDYVFCCEITENCDLSNPINCILKHLNTLALNHRPYAEIYFSKVGEYSYSSIYNKKIVNFESKDEFEDFLRKDFNKSVEKNHLTGVSEQEEYALIRLKFKKTDIAKKVNELFNQYLESSNLNDLEEVKKLFNQELQKEHRINRVGLEFNFPDYRASKLGHSYKAPKDLLLSLSFCSLKNNFLFLGFKYKGILPLCHDEERLFPALTQPLNPYSYDDDTEAFPNFLDLLYMLSKKVHAKVYSPELGPYELFYVDLEGSGEFYLFTRKRTEPGIW